MKPATSAGNVLLLILCLLLISLNSRAQSFSNNSIKASFGFAMNEGDYEIGVGTIVSLGYQKSVWKERARLSPYILTGGFMPLVITDTRDQFYRITSLGMNGYLDLLKIKPAALFIAGGGFVNYSRGLLGTGGWPAEGNNSSEYFLNMYFGGYLGAGIRIDPPGRRIAWEITPLNICFGNNSFMLSYLKIGVDIKL